MKPEHESTPPWTWHRNSEGDPVNLYDANDVIVMCPATCATGPVALVASPKVEELLRAAPEMEALLRRLHIALRATIQALPKSVKKYPPGAVEAAVDAAMFLEALDAAAKR